MEVVSTRCCGLAIHKRQITACRIVAGADGQSCTEVRTFGTMTADLRALADWLAEVAVTQVAMASTGVSWQPLSNILEDQFPLLLVNARHSKQVPGRKTDVRDCEWIADLLRHGLLRASFVPDRPQRELRELTRSRTSLVQERSAAANRLQQTLEGATSKLGSVASDLLGVSGRQLVEGLLAGDADVAALAKLARGKLREKQPDLERALSGRLGTQQRFLLARQLAHIDFLDEQIAQVSAEVGERLRPFAAQIARLDTIPGIGRRTAEVLLAEVGPEMERFPSAAHLASWAGMCPGNNERAGKRRSGRTRKGSPWLRAALVEAAHAAAHTKRPYLAAQYRRLGARRGTKRAAVAVGHTILGIVYHLLRDGTTYQDLGPLHFDQRDRQAVERRLCRRLEALGYKVTLEPAA
jgi:transposase